MSVIYKLDARTKLLSVLLLTVLIFLVNRLFTSLCLLLLLIVILKLSKIPFKGSNPRPLTLLAVFIIVMQTFFYPGDNFILKPLFPASFPLIGGMGSLKWEGLLLGCVIVCRFVSLFILYSAFSETTSPYSLAVGLNALGFSYTSAFVITTTFNLVPFFKEETAVIIDAQKLRGLHSLENGSFISRLRAYSGLALPLVLGAMRKAQISSLVMDSRAFGVYKKRTWLDKPQMKAKDFFFLITCIAFSAVFLFFNYFLG